jgi:hypothetical protein
VSTSTASPAPWAAARSGGEPFEVGTLAARGPTGIGHVGDPGHDGRLARRRRAHQNVELAVLAKLDARKPAAVSGHGTLDAGAEHRERLRRDAVLAARGREAGPVAFDGAHASVDHEPRIRRP